MIRECELQCKGHTFSFKIGILDFLRTEKNNTQIMLFPLQDTVQYDAWKNAAQLKDRPVCAMKTWFDTLFILFSAEPPKYEFRFHCQECYCSIL